MNCFVRKQFTGINREPKFFVVRGSNLEFVRRKPEDKLQPERKRIVNYRQLQQEYNFNLAQK